MNGYHQYDGLGSTDALVTDAEVADERLTFRAFGLQSPSTSASAQTWVGRLNYYRDSELGLYYLGSGGPDGCHFDPAAARVLRRDPVAIDLTRTNPYEYALNSPVNRVDPSGLADIVYAPLELLPGHVYDWMIKFVGSELQNKVANLRIGAYIDISIQESANRRPKRLPAGAIIVRPQALGVVFGADYKKGEKELAAALERSGFQLLSIEFKAEIDYNVILAQPRSGDVEYWVAFTVEIRVRKKKDGSTGIIRKVLAAPREASGKYCNPNYKTADFDMSMNYPPFINDFSKLPPLP